MSKLYLKNTYGIVVTTGEGEGVQDFIKRISTKLSEDSDYYVMNNMSEIVGLIKERNLVWQLYTI